MLQLHQGEIFANNYKLIRLIDTGGFADVWEAVFLNAGNTVALKIYPKLDADGVKNIELEYSNQSELSHSNLLIARYFGFHEGYPFLEMKYCSGGNASSKIGKLDEREMAKCIYDIASALEYLHEDNRVHQDIKPNNFLIDRNGKYYLADLGLSLKLRTTIQRFTTSKTSNTTIPGTTPPCFRAPELFDRSSIGSNPIKATDIWSLGASLFELASGRLPFGEFGGSFQINDPTPPDLSNSFSKELNFIIKKCLSKDTWDRPKAAELRTWAQNFIEKGRWFEEEKITPIQPIQPEKPVEKPKSHLINPFGTDKKKEWNKWPLLIGLLASIMISIGIGNSIKDNLKHKFFGQIDISYSNLILDNEVDSVYNFITEVGMADTSKGATIQLLKTGNTYQFREYFKKGVETDENYTSELKTMAAELSSAVFNGADLEIHCCDDQMTTLKVIPMSIVNFGKMTLFGDVQLFHTEDITADEVNNLGKYLIDIGWGKGNKKTVLITKSGSIYQFKMYMKKGIELDAEYTNAFKTMASEISKKVFDGQSVEVDGCDISFNTVRAYLMQ